MNVRMGVVVLLLLATGACEDDVVVVDTGTLEVAVATTGDGTDADGYEVLVDGASVGTIDIDGTLELELGAGEYSVELSGLGDGCSVDGDNPQAATVSTDEVTEVSFAVVCVSS